MLYLLKILILSSLVLVGSTSAADSKELECLARVVFHEARGEPLEGQIAVANVVMNRVQSSHFPNTICEVVYQPKQFTDIQKRTDFHNYDSGSWDRSMTSAVLVYLGKRPDNTKGALFYLNPDKVRKKVLTSWKKKYIVLTQISNHKFFGIKNKKENA